ncbi:hypothetical protein CONLIGDRAFT_241115 [Coniochaeta ligniaria NRRL 30616]|uniref:Uncharacterized protein n=1 Tax=Coniochaeta ligniaria NRRL 30616 TaxID=1408157 RepID=A0A1J7JVM2_9PEZI|nr:hypothetical protein CONLIGDRAFT_241115 [Coniochaeta ligniaria NRRL 30616]
MKGEGNVERDFLKPESYKIHPMADPRPWTVPNQTHALCSLKDTVQGVAADCTCTITTHVRPEVGIITTGSSTTFETVNRDSQRCCYDREDRKSLAYTVVRTDCPCSKVFSSACPPLVPRLKAVKSGPRMPSPECPSLWAGCWVLGGTDGSSRPTSHGESSKRER